MRAVAVRSMQDGVKFRDLFCVNEPELKGSARNRLPFSFSNHLIYKDMIKVIETFELPSWAFDAVFYYDYSGLSEEQINNVEKLLEKYPPNIYEFGVVDAWRGERDHFSEHPIFGEPCEVTNCYVGVYVRE